MEKQVTEKQQSPDKMSGSENVHRIIAEWKKRRQQDVNEATEKLNSPRFKEAISQLKKRNEEKGIFIPGV